MTKKKVVPNRQYTTEFKIEAVRLAESIGGNQAAKRLGIPDSNIWNWMRHRREGRLLGGAETAKAVKRPMGELEAEVNRLRRENASLRLDNEILKKAAAYFARESR